MRCFASSGTSFSKMMFRHWSWSDDGVIVKFTKVTREHRSGENWWKESRVLRNNLNAGETSTSWSPMRISVRPPSLWNSLFSRGFRTGSAFSTSCTSRMLPKRNALSSCFMNDLSRKDVLMTRFDEYRFVRNCMPWLEGSMSRG